MHSMRVGYFVVGMYLYMCVCVQYSAQLTSGVEGRDQNGVVEENKIANFHET